jgi:hypothetical protein
VLKKIGWWLWFVTLPVLTVQRECHGGTCGHTYRTPRWGWLKRMMKDWYRY